MIEVMSLSHNIWSTCNYFHYFTTLNYHNSIYAHDIKMSKRIELIVILIVRFKKHLPATPMTIASSANRNIVQLTQTMLLGREVCCFIFSSKRPHQVEIFHDKNQRKH